MYREASFNPLLIWDASAVKVWLSLVALPTAEVRELRQTLSADEQARASRYGSPQLQDAFIVRRGLLRHLIGKEQGCSPGSLQFSYNKFGKPALSSGDAYFSVSSSQEFVVFAFSPAKEVGVDIERVEEELPLSALIDHHFSPAEKTIFAGINDPANRADAFFRAWTGKEACAKAMGVGLSAPLARYEVLTANAVTTEIRSGPFMVRSLGLPASLGLRPYRASLAWVTPPPPLRP